jgi:hypothetical protein
VNVYIIEHDDGIDAGYSINGVYLTREAADASVVTRTASGARSRAYCAHNENCCSVTEYEVLDAPTLTVMEDPPDVPQGPGVIPDALVESILSGVTATNLYRQLGRRS